MINQIFIFLSSIAINGYYDSPFDMAYFLRILLYQRHIKIWENHTWCTIRILNINMIVYLIFLISLHTCTYQQDGERK